MKTKIRKTGLALCVSAALAVVAGCDKTPTVTNGRLDEDPAERTPGEKVDDKAITEKVKAALNADSVKYPDVEVASYQGTVQLSGFVALDEQRDRAGDLAKNVAGVKKVENKITLKQERKAP